MLREIAVIVAAIQFSEPSVTNEDALVIAEALQEEAVEHDFDPLTGVSIIVHESRFNAKAVSKNGEDYGLAQIRARYIGDCKKDADPLRAPSKACRRVKRRLLDPKENIRVMAELITQNRKFCRKKVGNANFARWLASYQGRNFVKRKRWCVPGKGTYLVINHRQQLLKELRKRRLLRK